MKSRLILQSAQGIMEKYLDLAGPVHEEYARRCDADYRPHRGHYDPAVHPAWNRIPLMLEAFEAGYSKVLWLDADVLVVDLTANIFTATDDTTPLHIPTSPSGMVWRGKWALCTGVIVANKTPEAIAALEYTWANRASPLLPHHFPGMWESNWLIDYVQDHLGIWKELPGCWNWKIGMRDRTPESAALIKGWHGSPHDQRWAEFSACHTALYGSPK